MKNIDFLFVYLSEQKSIFKKEQHTFEKIFEALIDEWKSARNQVIGFSIFVISGIITLLEFNWIDESIAVTIITITLTIAVFLTIFYELIRHKFLIMKLAMILKYTDSLWTISEIIRSLINYHILLKPKFNYSLYLQFLVSDSNRKDTSKEIMGWVS